MFHLKRFFLFSLFIFSSFSLLAVGEPGRPDVFHTLEGFDSEVESPLLSNRETAEISQLYPGIVRLILENGKGHGTGFFISPGMISTAEHVAGEGSLYFIDASTGERVFTEVLGVDEKYDVALLRAINYESEHFYSVGSLDNEMDDFIRRVTYEHSRRLYSPIKKGQSVTIPGFPHGDFNIVQGVVAGQLSFAPIVGITYKTDREMFTFGGISGAPVFSEDRDLIGVAIVGNRFPYFPEFIGFTPVEMLRDLVRRVEGRELFLPDKKEEVVRLILAMAERHNTMLKYKKPLHFEILTMIKHFKSKSSFRNF